MQPAPAEENLDKALIPTCTLLDKLFDGVRCLFFSYKLIIVEDTHIGLRDAQTYTQICVFGQRSMIPTAQMLHKSAAHKHRVATQRRHTAACKEMERRLEPEKIFQDV